MQHILVVDGDEHSRLMMEVSLEGKETCIHTASNSEKAFEILAESDIDLILSETVFTDEAPFKFVETLKANDNYSGIPLIFITRSSEVESKIRGLELGADDYLTKPIFLREFVDRIKGHLKRQEVSILEPGGLSQNRQGQLNPDLVHDILRSVLESKRAGVLYLQSNRQEAEISFAHGYVQNARLCNLHGIKAALMLLFWEKGRFKVQFKDKLETEGTILEQTEEIFVAALKAKRSYAGLLESNKNFANHRLAEILQLADIGPPPHAVDVLYWLVEAAGEDGRQKLIPSQKLKYLENLLKQRIL